VTEKGQKKIRIKWVRSGIGFSYRAKVMVRSLGLRRLNQVVEKPDTPQVRGLVARIPHLVAVVDKAPTSIWGLVPEYAVSPGEAVSMPKEPRRAKAAEDEKLDAALFEVKEPAVPAAPKRNREEPVEEAAPAPKRKKAPKPASAEKGKTKAVESKRKQKPAARKPAKGKK
jgi:large subunit ribosomal protein L30